MECSKYCSWNEADVPTPPIRAVQARSGEYRVGGKLDSNFMHFGWYFLDVKLLVAAVQWWQEAKL